MATGDNSITGTIATGDSILPTEMVERVARAMHNKDRPHKGWREASERTRLLYLGRALWVFLVMREPSEEMIAQGGKLMLDGLIEIEAAENNACGVWRAMIDRALGEAP